MIRCMYSIQYCPLYIERFSLEISNSKKRARQIFVFFCRNDNRHSQRTQCTVVANTGGERATRLPSLQFQKSISLLLGIISGWINSCFSCGPHIIKVYLESCSCDKELKRSCRRTCCVWKERAPRGINKEYHDASR